MKMKSHVLAVTALLTSFPLASHAVDLRFSGFGTLGYVQLDATDGTSFRGDSTKGGFYNHSLIAGQVDASLTDRFDFTLQAKVAEDLVKPEEFAGSLEMAFFAYQLSDEFRIRLGRMRAPLYLNSEFLTVGYAQNTATRADSVYAQMPFSYFDGVDLIYTKYLGNYELIIQPFFGTSELENASTLPNGERVDGIIKLNWMAGLNLSIAGDAWKFRVGYNTGVVDDQYRDKAISSLSKSNTQLAINTTGHPLNGLPFDVAYSSVEPSVKAAYEANTFNDDKGTFTTIGFNYDDLFILQAEVAKREVDDALGFADVTGGYVTLAKQFSDITPYVTYQVSQTADKNKKAGANNDFTGLGLGFRYDLGSFAFKAEATTFDFGEYQGSYANYYTQPDSGVKDLNRFAFVVETLF